jgi:threonine aldolase
MLGGGMRQSGMLAAAGIYALNNNIESLADDHRRAADLCNGLREAGFQVKTPPTNMVYVTLDTAPRWQADLEARGVRCFAVSATELRLVTHLDIDDADIAHAIAVFTALKGS